MKEKPVKPLILVDSADKARTVKKFVGRAYQVISTDGLLKDLPKSRIGIDENYAPDYITIRGKGKLLQELKRETFKGGRVFLAMNPDIAGEFLARQCCQLFGLNENSNCRMILDELTRESVKSAFKSAPENARSIDLNLVDAFQAKQIIDKYVSHKIGEYLSYKIYRGVKVGRFRAMLLKLINEVDSARNVEISKTLTGESLQELAHKELGFSPTKTRLIAEQLYEGVNFDKDGYIGLIKYPHGEIKLTEEIRTPDSVKDFLNNYQFQLYDLIYSAVNGNISRDLKLDGSCTDLLLMTTLDNLGVDWAEVYAVGINSLIRRQYVAQEGKEYKITALGKRVLNALDGFFDEDFSVQTYNEINEQIRKIAEGAANKNAVIADYCKKFNKNFEAAMASLGEDAKIQDEPVVESDKVCEKCGHKMIIKHGRYGIFLACSNYPECKNVMPYTEYIAQKCPKCGGRLTMRKFKGGRNLCVCENKDCGFQTWDEPIDKPCRECGSTMFAHKFRGRVPMLYCGNENCITRKDHPINKILADAKLRKSN